MNISWIKYFLTTQGFMHWAPITTRIGYWVSCILITYSLYEGLTQAPADLVQGEVFRIIYVHVPMAALSLALYLALAVMCFIYWVFHIKIADYAAISCAAVGCLVTALALATGSIWGKPTWGTWWVWDARLTTEALLGVLFLGYLSLRFTLSPREYAKKIAAVVGFLGVFDVPLIHYSVNWWYTLHQGSSILHLAKPTIAWPMLYPLLYALLGFSILIAMLVIHTMKVCILSEKQDKHYSPSLISIKER